MTDGRIELLNRILQHHKKRILSIKDDSDIILHGNEILNQDLEIIASEIDFALTQLNDPKIGGAKDINLLCSAINCYIHDLEEAKKIVNSKLYAAKLEFKMTDEEIRKAGWAKNDICKESF